MRGYPKLLLSYLIFISFCILRLQSFQQANYCTILRSRNAQRGFIIKNALTFFPKQKNLLFYIIIRAGNSLIGFLSESLIFGGQPERFAHGCSFLVSNLSDSLSLLIFGERPERFAHIAHKKEGMSESLIF